MRIRKHHIILSLCLACASGLHAEWGNSPETNILEFPEGTNNYAHEVAVSKNGDVWSVIYHPNYTEAAGEEDVSHVVYEYRLQCHDRDGNPRFAPEGLLVSAFKNKSYTVVNNYLFVDDEGNAVVMVSDLRNSNERGMSFTAYRVSPQGEMLWGEDGVAVSNAERPCALFSCMQGVEMDDGSFMFAWVEYGAEPQIHLQRITSEGEALWGKEGRLLQGESSCYPFLVKSIHNTAILVYAGGPSKIIYAKKIDFNGEECWAQDARIYRGGWGSTPIHTMIKAYPSGDGGVLVAWHDDRKFSNKESVYLSYVTYEGKIGFAGASDEGDVKLDYEGYRCFTPSACMASDGSGFYVAYRVTSQSQNYQGVRIQKVSLDGELLFGESGKDVMPLVFEGDPNVMHTCSGYISIQPDTEGGACVFFGKYFSWTDQGCFAYRVDPDGNAVWPGGEVQLSPDNSQSASLKSVALPGSKAWVYTYAGDNDHVHGDYMNLLSEDGVIGATAAGVTVIDDDENGWDDLGVTGPFKVYSIDGRMVAEVAAKQELNEIHIPGGVYVVTSQHGETMKIHVK